jgi:hypothetical protein
MGRLEHDRPATPFSLVALVALVGLWLASCGHVPPPPPLPPGGATCSTACARGRALVGTDGKPGCEWARPTPSGATCEAVCESFEASGTLTYGVECVTTAPTCDAAETCGGPK